MGSPVITPLTVLESCLAVFLSIKFNLTNMIFHHIVSETNCYLWRQIMEWLYTTLGIAGVYGFGWIASVRPMVKLFLNPKFFHIVKMKNENYSFSGTYYSLRPGARPSLQTEFTEENSQHMVDRAYDRAHSTAWIWPIAWIAHFALARAATKRYELGESYSTKAIEEKRGKVLVQAIRKGLDHSPIIVKIMEAPDTRELRKLEAKVESHDESFVITQKANRLKTRMLSNILRREPMLFDVKH